MAIQSSQKRARHHWSPEEVVSIETAISEHSNLLLATVILFSLNFTFELSVVILKKTACWQRYAPCVAREG